MKHIKQTILHTIQQNDLMPSDETIVVAVSGGADSLALLHVLNALKDTLRIHLHVATFNHQLRADAADDARFVEVISREWGLSVSVGEEDVARLAHNNNKLGIEDAARQARYRFLAEVAREQCVKRIVTAHHADDQAETVLMHMLRGSGLQGLQGMRPVAEVPGQADMLLVRPLLNVQRVELEAYCRAHGLQPREDESNMDIALRRNYVRHEVLPVLQQINPQVASALTRLADNVALDLAFIDEHYAEVAARCMHTYDNYVVMERTIFNEMHPAIQRRCLLAAITHLQGTPSQQHIIQAIDVAQNGATGAIAEFPDGLRLRIEYDKLIIESQSNALLTPAQEYQFLLGKDQTLSLKNPGKTLVPGSVWSVEVEIVDEAAPPPPTQSPDIQLIVPTGSKLSLRTRRPGDRFTPLGMHGHSQKLKDWMINRKIPQQMRDHIPLLIVDGTIAALLIGEPWPIAEQFRVLHGQPLNKKQTLVAVFVVNS